MCGFGEREVALVRSSWDQLMQNIPHYSIRFFTSIVEIAPVAKDMFSFLRASDEIPQNNPQLQAHAVKVFKMTYESAIQLQEKGEVVIEDSTLKHLGFVHVKKGVLEPHFEVLKGALLNIIKEAMREKWSEDMNNAWSTAFDELATAIKREMTFSVEGVEFLLQPEI
ncbi:hypothetical protein K1719_025036 [Acacia pycnantha]|nr:hypothetical protein K1719_025036 [Acacia pycnantha]